MHAVGAEDVHGSSQRCRNRRHEDGATAVVQHLDDERWNERLLDFDQGRLPHVLAALAGESLGETAKEPVARKALEERCFNSLSDSPTHARSDRRTDYATDGQD